ncbi:MAG: hypothetical protein HC880_19840 [Bacteroidia bacterium]|nr:hypothetical protein [Bacteroidia bacterium]
MDVPEEDARQAMVDSHTPDWIINALMELNHITRQGWTNVYAEDYKNVTGKEYSSAFAFFEANQAAF